MRTLHSLHELVLLSFGGDGESGSAASSRTDDGSLRRLVGVIAFTAAPDHYVAHVRVDATTGSLSTGASGQWQCHDDGSMMGSHLNAALHHARCHGYLLLYAAADALPLPSSAGSPYGLPNLGNTCYLNAALQLLLRCPLTFPAPSDGALACW